MTPTWDNTELRVLARRQRELKAKPWLRPVERATLDIYEQRLRDIRSPKSGDSNDYNWNKPAIQHTPTGRVDRLTGTIEIGGRVQEWELVNHGAWITLHIHKHSVMNAWTVLGHISVYSNDHNGYKEICAPKFSALSPDPNFTPPGQYVQGANGMKFWVKQTETQMHVCMNDVHIFTIEPNEKMLFIPAPIRRITNCLQSYTYTGCQCDTCGGGE